MFICDGCEKVSEGVMEKVVVEKRDRVYYNLITKYVEGEKKEIQKTTNGWEIVREEKLCGGCYERYKKNQPNTEISKENLAEKSGSQAMSINI